MPLDELAKSFFLKRLESQPTELNQLVSTGLYLRNRNVRLYSHEKATKEIQNWAEITHSVTKYRIQYDILHQVHLPVVTWLALKKSGFLCCQELHVNCSNLGQNGIDCIKTNGLFFSVDINDHGCLIFLVSVASKKVHASYLTWERVTKESERSHTQCLKDLFAH